MIVCLPKSTVHPRVKITVEHRPTQFACNTIADITVMSEVEIETPVGVDIAELEITSRFCNARGQHDEGVEAEVIQAAKTPDEADEADEDLEAGQSDEDLEAGQSDEDLEALTAPDIDRTPAPVPYYPLGNAPQ